MAYEERNTWANLLVTAVALAVYVVVVLQQAGGRPLTDVEWWPIMLWTIGGSIVGTVVVSFLWSMVAGMRDPDGVDGSDARDRDISRFGDRIGQAFLIIAGLGVLVLCAFQSHWFWVANTMFFGFAVANLAGGVVRILGYRRGLA